MSRPISSLPPLLLAASVLTLGPLGVRARGSAQKSAAKAMAGKTPIATASLGKDRLELRASPSGQPRILRIPPAGAPRELHCGALQGAWGLWTTDVNGDGRTDLVIALWKKARFDPVLGNRLHVHTLAGDRCVPLWRGTRLAGRFLRARPDGSRLVVLEEVGGGRRRLARYAWTGFGYAMKEVIWQGSGAPPAALATRHLGARGANGDPR
ncbi:MAG: hypothetical protein RBU30_02460 [Polyangia bacterium]|nr:hypothetical protein [Polyangia bacterium]